MPQKDRREYPRAKAVCPVIMENNGIVMSGETQDISIGGAYIRCRSPLMRPEVTMYISVSLLSPRFQAMGEVVRSEVISPPDKVQSYGRGVRSAPATPR